MVNGHHMNSEQVKTKKATIHTSLGDNPSTEKNIPENVVWIDDAFYIKKTRYGLYTSVLKNPLGANFLTGATEDGILQTTRWHLKCLQEDTLHLYTRVVNSTVGVKL